MIGAFIGFAGYSSRAARATPSSRSGALLRTIMLAATVGCGLLGVAIERSAYRVLCAVPRFAR